MARKYVFYGCFFSLNGYFKDMSNNIRNLIKLNNTNANFNKLD